MQFIEAVKTCLIKKYAVFSGRATRSEYWYFILFCVLIDVALSLPEGNIFHLLGTLWSLVTFLPTVSAGVRRLHDIDRSGWWWLLPLTIIGIPVLIYWNCKRGAPGENRFGAAVG